MYIHISEYKRRQAGRRSIVIEYLAQHHPGKGALIPADRELALEVRLWDRLFDFYVHEPMQRVVADRLRPKESRDAHGVSQAKAQIQQAYAVIDRHMADKRWAAGDAFSMADCAACPALHYADRVAPIGDAHGHVRAYLERLTRRDSFARVLREAEPYAAMFPEE